MSERIRYLLAGATGLVGGSVARLLPASQLTLVGRRQVPDLAASQLTGSIADWPQLMSGHACDVAICALGTTIRVAGSQHAFAAVDRGAVIAFAAAAKANGARQCILVSSVGASPSASNFYLKTKGEAEAGVGALTFDRLDIFRPGLLKGDRKGPTRYGEAIAIAVSPVTDLLTPHVFDKYRSTAVSDLASAIVAIAGRREPGQFIHHNREIAALAQGMG